MKPQKLLLAAAILILNSTCLILNGSAQYTKLFDFDSINGSNPQGSLISDGTCLYGMTEVVGTNSMGTVFRYYLVTGIAENNMKNGFNVYPNPTNGVFTITIDNGKLKMNNGQLTINSLIGEKIYQSEINNPKSEIDLSNQPNGVYFVNIKTEQGVASKKNNH